MSMIGFKRTNVELFKLFIDTLYMSVIFEALLGLIWQLFIGTFEPTL